MRFTFFLRYGYYLIRVSSWESLLPPISGVTVTFLLRRLLSFERAVGIAKLSQMRDFLFPLDAVEEV